MIGRLVQKKKLFLAICVLVFLALWVLTLLFATRGDKTILLVLSLVIPFVVYGCLRLSFVICRKIYSLSFMKFMVRFVFVMGLLVMALMFFDFIRSYPNGIAGATGAYIGFFAAALGEEKKNIEAEQGK